MIVHGFAGIGWSEALRSMGLTDIGLELAWPACRTRIAAGHTTIHCDVTQYPTAPFKSHTVKKIDSPPCPGFGKSGKKLGLRDLPLVHQAIDDLAHGSDTRAAIGAACLDERSILTAEPMRWHYDLRPEWIAMEQVPSVLPVWQQYAEILTRWGYSTATGVLDAADYGLGQRRPRAVLIASRVREVVLPAPTHGGLGQPPLVAMAEVIGWGYTRRPAPTVTGGGTATGGAEPFGNGTRQAMKRAIGTDAWKDRGVPHLRPTIAECAALQGFRPGLKFHGRQGQQHLIVGNAVPVPLADAVIRAAAGVGERNFRAAA
ncbi:DNA cytosine methyltransferase [Streptomyces bangladeshensis]|uniref:DNA (cytosine-5-)-methyltransferase n=1 Tax=Streptomyces bangladeshensis TaxID=295352 RepID=A0ABN3BE87_9ACTN